MLHAQTTLLGHINYEQEAQTVARAVLHTLRSLHAKQLIHGDLKPENILILPRGHQKTEGGVATSLQESDIVLADLEWMTRSGAPRGFAGSAGYMSPEVLQHYCEKVENVLNNYTGPYGFVIKCAQVALTDRYTTKYDMFALGVTLYTMLAHSSPFRAKSWDLMQQRTARGATFQEPHWNELSESSKQFVALLLTVDPAARPGAEEALCHPWLSS